MNDHETIRPEVASRIIDILGHYKADSQETITLETNIGTLEMDSLDKVDFIEKIETQFNVRIPDENMDALTTSRLGRVHLASRTKIDNLDEYASGENLARYVQRLQASP